MTYRPKTMHRKAPPCRASLLLPVLPGSPLHAPQRTQRQRTHRDALVLCPATVQDAATEARNVGQRDQRAARTSAPSASLVDVLLRSAVSQATDQLQSTLVQVNKLTKGFQPRPEGYPPGPAGDSAADMLLDPLSFLERVSKQYGAVVGLVLGGESVILVTGGTAAQQVLMTQAAIYKKEGTAFFPGSSLAGQGLLVSDGAIWQRQRQLTNPAFRRAAVEAYAAAMSQATQHMLDSVWAAGGSRDVYADYNELTLSITTNALFGVNMSSSQSAGISNAVRVAFDFFSKRAALGFIVPEWLPTAENVQYHAAVAQLDTAVYGIIADREQLLSQLQSSSQQESSSQQNQCLLDNLLLSKNEEGHKCSFQSLRDQLCLLDNLLLSKDEEGQGLSLQSLRDQLMTLLVAGQETSAILLGWTTAFLAHNPDVQRQAAAEVQQVLQGEAPTPDSVRQLPYLERVVLETLRLRPPAYMVGRCAAQQDTLAGFTVSQGTTVLVSPYVMHRDSTTWRDPDHYIPDRWCQYQEAKQSPASSSTSTSSASASASPSGHSHNSIVSSNGSGSSHSNTNAAQSTAHDVINDSRQTRGSGGNGTDEQRSMVAAYTNSSHGHERGASYSSSGSGRVDRSSNPQQQGGAGSHGSGQTARASAASILSGMGPNGSYVPFGAGPRNCIGTGFAMMEAMLVLAAGLQKYEFITDASALFPEATPRITLRPAAVQIVLRPREFDSSI